MSVRTTRTHHTVRGAVLVLLAVLLSGCFQAQLNGPVAGAQITISDLNDPNQVYASATTIDEAFMEGFRDGETWGRANEFTKLWWLGVFQVNVASLDDNTWYLVTASGGEDTDVDRNNEADDTFTPVTGEWRAIMSGAQLKELGPKVSAMTEAAYQWLQPQLATLNGDQIRANLDRAAQQLLDDVDRDNDVDANDLVMWSRLFNNAQLRADVATVNQIANNIIVGGSESDRASLVDSLITIEVTEETDISPESYFNDHIAGPILDARCQTCHYEGGVADAGGAELIFLERGAENEDARNAEILEEFINSDTDAPERLLTKVQGGLNHGGGVQFTTLSDEYGYLETYVSLVTGDEGPGGPSGGFWDGLSFADARQTLRRAALIFAGRAPTEAEYAQADQGEAGLRAALLGLLEGSGFHDFLVSGANDRLHTDAFLRGLFLEVSDINAFPFYPMGADKYYNDQPTTDEEQQAKWRWEQAWQVGLARAPLELIAYVVENDLPYTEILTADYTMVNWQSSEFLRSGVDFGGQQDNLDFRPGQNRGQVIVDDNLVAEYYEGFGLRIDAHGPFIEDYPHAGILNTQAYLNRYPTTETNRNRARARWTYLHFLGVDIEKSASRTTDPDALADTNNPTMNNPACNVCHQLHDPVAGTFQNYGNEGWYRSSWGGRDSLPDTYKYPEWFDENADPSPYQEGDTWFRDMRNPGIDGKTAGNPVNSLQWLAQEITNDPRFAVATVMFWWPAVMGTNVLEAPASSSDANYQQLLNAFNQQTEDIQTLAEGLRNGFDSGRVYNLKDLLVEMATSGWFRANAVDPGADSGRERELDAVGTRRLLTPRELEEKSRNLLGYAWQESEADWDWDGRYSGLGDRFRIYYGGIDSFGIKDRARQLTALMSNVATRMALESACYVVLQDFDQADNERRLFDGLDPLLTPSTEGRQQQTVPTGYGNRSTQSFSLELQPGEKRLRVSFANPHWDDEAQEGNQLFIDRVRITRGATTVLDVEGENIPDTPFFEVLRYYGDVRYEFGQPVAWQFWSDYGWISVPFEADTAGTYRVEVTAWGYEGNLGSQSVADVAVNTTEPYGDHQGATELRAKIQQLYGRLLGEELDAGDEEIEIIYELLVESWLDRIANGDGPWATVWPEENCPMPGHFYALPPEDQNRMWSDASLMKGSWMTVLTYMMTHYKYLHE